MEAPGFGQDLIAGEPVDAQDVDGGLLGWKFFVDLGEAGFERTVALAEAGRRNLVGEVQLIGLVPFVFYGRPLAFEVLEALLLARDPPVQGVHLSGDISSENRKPLSWA